MIDAFYSDGVPFHMTTLEFMELLRDRLTPGGVVATNVIGALARERLADHPRAVEDLRVGRFRPCGSTRCTRARATAEGTTSATSSSSRPSVPRRHARGCSQSWNEVRAARAPNAPDLARAVRDRWDRPVQIADVPLLTDGYAPTDALLIG